MVKLTVDVPEELLAIAFPQEDLARRMVTEATVAELVRARHISSGRASEILGISRWDLPAWMTRFNVSSIDLSPEDTQPF